MRTELSSRELAVLTLAVQGFTDDMIAKELSIERGTVNSYWVRIRGKMGHCSRTELVAKFVQKNADSDNAMKAGEIGAATAEREDEQKKLLDKANVEIERLKKLLAGKRG
jgi:DNA-binding CsgD family transcriptional regulator